MLVKVQAGRHTSIQFSYATVVMPSLSQPRFGYLMNSTFKSVFTWFGSGSTSFHFSVKSPQSTGVKGLCLTEGRMRYNQLEEKKRD